MFVSASNELKFHRWPGCPAETATYGYNGTDANILSVSWSKGDGFFVYLRGVGTPEIISVKDAREFKLVHRITAVDNATAVAFQRTTKRGVAIGTESSTLALYDTRSKSIVKVLALTAPVVHVEFNVNDQLLAIACRDGEVSVYNVVEGVMQSRYVMKAVPTALRFHPEMPRVFAVGARDGGVLVKNIRAAFLETAHADNVNGIAYDTEQNRLLTAGEDRKFCVHDLPTNTCLYVTHLQFPLTSMDSTADGKHVLIGTNCGHIILYANRNLRTPVATWKPHETRVRFIKCTNKTPPPLTPSVSINEIDSTTSEFNTAHNNFVNRNGLLDLVGALKDNLLEEIRRNSRAVYQNIDRRVSSLQELLGKEFAKMNGQMEEDWNGVLGVDDPPEEVEELQRSDSLF